MAQPWMFMMMMMMMMMMIWLLRISMGNLGNLPPFSRIWFVLCLNVERKAAKDVVTAL
jgi:hypothetical protein